MKDRKAKRAVLWAMLGLLCALPPALLLLYRHFASRKELAQAAVDRFALPVRTALGKVSALFPFSLTECVYTLLGLCLLWYLALAVVRTVKSGRKLRTALQRAGALALAVLYAACGCLWLWGLDYRAFSFSEKEGFSSPAVAKEDLCAAAEYFVRNAAALSDTVPRDEDGGFLVSPDTYGADARRVYARLEQRYASLATPAQAPKKMALYSGVMSRIGFTGVYFCFTGESNINIDQPQAFLPFTIAHELAHQKGVASEQECNFLGILAGITSDLPEYRYSCYLAGSLHLMNALATADPDTWWALQDRITGSMRRDLDENDEYWNSRRTKVTDASEKLYDSYLKANGQELGMKSYGACVDLLVEYWKTEELP